jgi:fructosamine-3-kinase
VIAHTLEQIGDGLHRLVLPDGRRAIIKRRRNAPDGFFAMEAHGLELLRRTAALRVPEVYATHSEGIVLEDLGSGRATDAEWQRAGRALTALHAQRGPYFGLDRDGWCGACPQSNTPTSDGWQFFAEQRLLFQGKRAFDARLLERADLAALERLCAQLQERIPAQPPVLVHGDLWTGNLHECANGEIALIDAAAAHYGWAEADLAMLTLFGAPPARFFAAYEEAAGIDASWRTRAPLYNLYHLLNHLNLFGTGYLGAVRTALRGA